MRAGIARQLARAVMGALVGVAAMAHASEPAIRPPGAGVFVLPAVPSTERSGAVAEQRLVVNEVVFHGNRVVPDAVLRAIATPYLGRPIGALEVEELRRLLTLHYVNQGYVTSGALVNFPGDYAGGLLHVAIVEGRVVQVRVSGQERLSEHYVAERLMPESKEALHIGQLRERYELLLSDPLFSAINTRLVPDVEQGRSILYVEVARARPYQLSVFANNYRAPSVGESALGLSGWLRNLSGFGDQLSANFQGPAGTGKWDRYALSWTLPLNARGTQLSLQLDDGTSSVIENPLQQLDIRSKLSNAELGLGHAVLDSLHSRLAYGLARSHRNNRTWLLGEPFSFTAAIPQGVLTESTWKLWQDFSWRTDTRVLAARITRYQVHNNLLPPISGYGGGAQPEGHYGYWLTQLSLGQRLGESGVQLQARATLQNAPSRMTALDRFGMGGASTVRGYRENQLLRDRGAVLNLEVDLPVGDKRESSALQFGVTPFFAWAKGSNVGEAPSVLSSAGLALRAEGYGLSANLVLARRLIRPAYVDALGGTQQDQGIHLQLSYSIF